MKRFLATALSFALLLSVSACGSGAQQAASSAPAAPSSPSSQAPASSVDESSLSGTIQVWSSGEELGRFVKGFNEKYPNIKVNITVVPNADFVAKLTPALAGGNAPDVFTGESDYVKYLVEAGCWDDLTAAPYSVKQYTDDVWDYVVSVGTDSKARSAR